MAHLEKFTRVACGHMFKHYERAKDKNGEYLKFGNQDINPEESPYNFNMAPNREISQWDFLNQRCAEVQCMRRKDVNVMCSWVVTKPQGLAVMDEQFFTTAYEFLSKRYGEKNVISSYVHMDENSPHMHFSFVPVVFDKKKGIEKVSAFECISRKELKTFHKDLSKHMLDFYGFDVGILNGATENGNRTVHEMKMEAAAERLKKTEAEFNAQTALFEKKYETLIEVHENKKFALNEQIETLEGQIKTLKKDINVLREHQTKEKENLKDEKQKVAKEKTKLSQVREESKKLQAENKKVYSDIDKVREIRPRKTVLGIQDITMEQIEWLKNIAETQYYGQINDRKQREKFFAMRDERDEAVSETNNTKRGLQKLKQENDNLKKLKDAFERLPKEQQEYLLNPPTLNTTQRKRPLNKGIER